MSVTNPATLDAAFPLPAEELRALWHPLKTTRLFDEHLVNLFRSGQLKGTYFSAVGQEACDTVPVFFANAEDDCYFPSHRDLAAAITRGLPLKDLAATILSRATSEGQGAPNPTWWSDTDRNYLAFSPSIGNQYCVGVGAALAMKMRGLPNVALVFLGEGGSSKGALYEGMNFAGLHRLPVIFVVQNNGWAESCPIHLQCAVEDLSLRALGFNMPGQRLDGNDVMAMIGPVKSAVAHARAGEGPSFFQFDTYRWYGHSTADPAGYRDEAEVEYWKSRDPVARYEAALLTLGVMTQDDLDVATLEIEAAIDHAITAALADPEPDPDFYKRVVYCPDGPLPARIQRKFAG